MHDLSVLGPAVTHQLYGVAVRAVGRRAATDDRDRGAVSLEQVLWFVAAGVSVAVIAAILWNNIRDEANTPIDTPTAPTP
ncbi:MAG: hypothetical protein QNJ12_04370 [Ilumatobacter sp.]|uniref:hypothetical protein n=1 Tax=Ilumatobacter sp. TaxID=1967498 RepID=UPI002624EFB0|nr:hypothetical protein [Ilumatobacter sp.]MDJ0768000.1 hypothetical protein [Ilumatobacter sp.]